MQQRPLGRTGMSVSAVGFGAWAIGSSWGEVDDHESMAALHAAADAGVNFFDTADVYGDGRSERLVARLRKERPREQIWIATKVGRRLPAQTPEGYSRENLNAWVERSLQNLAVETLDLLQLHCPHPAVYDRPEVFGFLEELVAAGQDPPLRGERRDRRRGAEGDPLTRVETVQIIFNMLRLKPAERLFAEAEARQVGIIARVPLASGLLTGKLGSASTFAPDDHRAFNREGAAFDKGETFSGVPYEAALEAVDALRPLVPPGASLTQFALRWILMWNGVSCVIPGAKTPTQARENAGAGEVSPITPETMAAVKRVYDERIHPLVHDKW